MDSNEWAAALFIGEGHAGVVRRKSGQNTREYVMMNITMLDLRAMERFAAAVGLSPQYRVAPYPRDPTRMQGRVNVTHLLAAGALNRMLPYMRDTDKGDQAERAFERCGYTRLPNGVWCPPPTKPTGVPGNQNAKGKTWTLSPETRRRMSEARQRREATRHSG